MIKQSIGHTEYMNDVCMVKNMPTGCNIRITGDSRAHQTALQQTATQHAATKTSSKTQQRKRSRSSAVSRYIEWIFLTSLSLYSLIVEDEGRLILGNCHWQKRHVRRRVRWI
jgi:hypothetical protein